MEKLLDLAHGADENIARFADSTPEESLLYCEELQAAAGQAAREDCLVLSRYLDDHAAKARQRYQDLFT